MKEQKNMREIEKRRFSFRGTSTSLETQEISMVKHKTLSADLSQTVGCSVKQSKKPLTSSKWADFYPICCEAQQSSISSRDKCTGWRITLWMPNVLLIFSHRHFQVRQNSISIQPKLPNSGKLQRLRICFGKEEAERLLPTSSATAGNENWHSSTFFRR